MGSPNRLKDRVTGPLLGLALVLGLGGPARAVGPPDEVAAPPGVHLVRPEGTTKGLLLYLPEHQGWDRAAADRARRLAGLGYVVAGIEARALNPPEGSDPCWDLAGGLLALAQRLREGERVPPDALPILVGEGEGAALAYGALAQAPAHRLHAVLTRGFCPAPFPGVPPCPAAGASGPLVQDGSLQPVARVETAWFAVDSREGACAPGVVEDFVARIENARLVPDRVPERVAERASPAAEAGGALTALLQWLDPRIPNQVETGQTQQDVAGLPLIEVPATGTGDHTLAVMLSGDGGWAALDRGVSAELARQGMATLGWDSLSYYWKARTPEAAALDLERALRHYLGAWDKQNLVLIGYSFGADVLPFLVNRLPPDLRAAVTLVVLLGAGPTASFEFHLSDWLSASPRGDSRPLMPELQRLPPTRLLCVYGSDEREGICPGLQGEGIAVRRLPGDHHFGGDYRALADLIVQTTRGAGP